MALSSFQKCRNDLLFGEHIFIVFLTKKKFCFFLIKILAVVKNFSALESERKAAGRRSEK